MNLDQWEAEAKEQWKNIEHARCAERILELIKNLRESLHEHLESMEHGE